MRRRRPPRTERAFDGYQVPRAVPARLPPHMKADTSEDPWTRRLTQVEAVVCIEIMRLGAELFAVREGGYCIRRRGGDIIGGFRNLRACRAWAYGERFAGGAT